ncbi:cytochrome b N-terminal domain-containing protein [Thermanaeromonas sp. C210]|uniref:cytochrome b N-terminal domain-containing protein n=1 Tax=Thermanaeromonas sp. C210 TaxID=2731925 RepID=UPI00155CE7D5|nr:cytochrome b N-terminal domain-containing protein [Thermanaeromonas sp. C210]GFN22837.1 cytochrome b6 [Thermanaeromonas sp. C210]
MASQLKEPDLKSIWREVADHPVPFHARSFLYCFGGLTFLTFLVQTVTGIILAIYYRPTPEMAYQSVKFIMEEVPMGSVIRSVHNIGANLMVILVVIHMLRVIYTGSYKPPRQFNWVVGVSLLLLVLTFCFTGYLLVWDQVGYWAAIIGTKIMGSIPLLGDKLLVLTQGGTKVTGYTLTRFYALHVVVLPILTLILMGIHFFLVRKQGISGGL